MSKGRDDESSAEDGFPGPEEDTAVLARLARDGDREALNRLCRRFHETWLRLFHGRLSPEARRLYDTADLVQSAMIEVVRKVRMLRNEAAFFSWVMAIIERKNADASRLARKGTPVHLDEREGPAESGLDASEATHRKDQYLRTLDCIIELFPVYHESMSIWYLRHVEELAIGEIALVIESSISNVEKYLKTARSLILSRLASG